MKVRDAHSQMAIQPPTEVQAAKGLESMFLGQMVESMRTTVPDDDYLPRSQTEKIYQGLLDFEYARMLSETGSFGIADQVLREMHQSR